MTDQDKAVALAEKLNPYPIGSNREAWRKGFLGNRNIGARGSDYDRIYKLGAKARTTVDAMLTDHAQQVREELAKASGVMPEEINFGNGFKFCRAEEVREAIASLQAKVEQAEDHMKAEVELLVRTLKLANHEHRKTLAKLEQSDQRVRELEANAAAWTALNEPLIDEYLESYEMRGETADGHDTCYTPDEAQVALIKDAIMGLLAEVYMDSAMKKENGG